MTMGHDGFEIVAVDGGVAAPAGFTAAGVSAGIKRSGKRDLCVITAASACPAAGVFTRSSAAAPPVLLSREHLAGGVLRAVVVNAGNANAMTGITGMEHARTMAVRTAAAIGCATDQVAVCSTGVIGVPLPVERVTAGIDTAVRMLAADGGDDAALAILTTDTVVKQAAVRVEVDGRSFTVGGMAKGSGMIQPNMATMLAFITTDAPLSSQACDTLLRAAVAQSFNRITVDSDTSTNDSCILMASGAEGGPMLEEGTAAYRAVAAGLAEVATELAKMVVRDGEGATKFVTVDVRGARSEHDAEVAAFSIANSPLVKTALFGEDANWGRVAGALGKSSATVDQSRIEIALAGITMCRDGVAIGFDEVEATSALAAREVTIEVDLHIGDGEATVWTCDFSYDYVRINGDYRS